MRSSWRVQRMVWCSAVGGAAVLLGGAWANLLSAMLVTAGYGVHAERPSEVRVLTRVEAPADCDGCPATLLLSDVNALSASRKDVAVFSSQRANLKWQDQVVRVHTARVGASFLRIWRPKFLWRTAGGTGVVITARVADFLGIDSLVPSDAAILVDGVPTPLNGVVPSRAGVTAIQGAWLIVGDSYWPAGIGPRALVGAISREPELRSAVPGLSSSVLVLRSDEYIRRFQEIELRAALARALMLSAVSVLSALLLALWARGMHGHTAALRRQLAGESWLKSWSQYLWAGLAVLLVGLMLGAATERTSSSSGDVEGVTLVLLGVGVIGVAGTMLAAAALYGGHDQGRREMPTFRRTDDQARAAILVAAPLAVCWIGGIVAVVVPLSRQISAYAGLASFASDVVRVEIPATAPAPMADEIRWWTLPLGTISATQSVATLGVMAPESFWAGISGVGGRADGPRIAVTSSAWTLLGTPPLGSSLPLRPSGRGTLVAVVPNALPAGLHWAEGSRLRAMHSAQAWIEQRASAPEAFTWVAGPWREDISRSALGRTAQLFPDFERRWRRDAQREWRAVLIQSLVSIVAVCLVASWLITFAISQRARLIAVSWLTGAPPAVIRRIVAGHVVWPLMLSATLGCTLWAAYAKLLFANQAPGDSGIRVRAWGGIAGGILLLIVAAVWFVWKRVQQLDAGRGSEWLSELVAEDE